MQHDGCPLGSSPLSARGGRPGHSYTTPSASLDQRSRTVSVPPPKMDQIWPNSGQFCAMSGRCWPKLAGVGTHLVGTKFGTTRANVGQSRAKFGRDSMQRMSEFGRCRAKALETRAELGRRGPNFIGPGPSLADPKHLLDEIDRTRPDIVRNRPKFGRLRVWPSMFQFRAQVAPKFSQSRPSWARDVGRKLCQDVGEIGPPSGTLAEQHTHTSPRCAASKEQARAPPPMFRHFARRALSTHLSLA